MPGVPYALQSNDYEKAYKVSDRALYMAKKSGRGKIIFLQYQEDNAGAGDKSVQDTDTTCTSIDASQVVQKIG